MGAASIQSLLDLSFDMKGMVLGNKGSFKSSSNGSLWSKVLAAQSMRRRRRRQEGGLPRRRTLIMMKRRRAHLEGSRRQQVNGVEGKVRNLKKLVPNGNSMDFEGLLMETAHYISSLEMQVKVMKIMVSVLSDEGSNDEN